MSDVNNGGPAFPLRADNMSLRQWFAGMAPSPSEDWLSLMRNADQARNPHNDSYKPSRRSDVMLIALWKYEFADAMIAAGAK